MTVHLVNPSHLSFGVGVITPRWLFVLAGATPAAYGRPQIIDETLEPFDVDGVEAGDIVGIGIHTATRFAATIGNRASARGATVVFGGIHATLYPDEARQLGGAHAVVRGDGDVIWPLVLDHAHNRALQRTCEGGRVDAERFVPARLERCRKAVICGDPCRRSAGAPSTFVLLGVAHSTARNRGSAGSTVSPRLSSSDVMGSGSSRLPTTTSIPSR